MRSPLLIFLSVLSFFSFSAHAQQANSSTADTPTPQRITDPQAITVLNQALGAAGGTTAISAIQDYVATGNVTYHWTPDVQGTVTISSRGAGDIRIDANLPDGARSSVTTAGQVSSKSEKGTIWQMPQPDKVVSSDAFPYQARMFPSSLAIPYLPLANALTNTGMNIFYKGTVTLDGHSVYDVQVQPMKPGATANATPFVFPVHNSGTRPTRPIRPDLFAEATSVDFFIDASTYQVSMIQDVMPIHVLHQVRYGNYTLTNGVSIPFSISDSANGQNGWQMQLNQIQFNQGLQDSAFLLQ